MTTMEKIFSRERYKNLFYNKYQEWVNERKKEKARQKNIPDRQSHEAMTEVESVK